MTIVTTLPPEILNYYASELLSKPIPNFYDDSSTLYKKYNYILKNLERKCNNVEKLEAFKGLETKFLELYEQAKTKEEDYEKKTGKPRRESFDYFGDLDRGYKDVFRRIRYKAQRTDRRMFRSNNEI